MSGKRLMQPHLACVGCMRMSHPDPLRVGQALVQCDEALITTCPGKVDDNLELPTSSIYFAQTH